METYERLGKEAVMMLPILWLRGVHMRERTSIRGRCGRWCCQLLTAGPCIAGSLRTSGGVGGDNDAKGRVTAAMRVAERVRVYERGTVDGVAVCIADSVSVAAYLLSSWGSIKV